MAELFVVDTHLYIDALRNRDAADTLKQFRMRMGLRMRFAGVVALELGAGAVTEAHDDAVRDLMTPYILRDCLLGTSFGAYRAAGRVLAALARAEGVALARAPASLTNDAVLPASCREAGATLITNNHRAFSAIRRHLRGFRFAAPWPGAAAM